MKKLLVYLPLALALPPGAAPADADGAKVCAAMAVSISFKDPRGSYPIRYLRQAYGWQVNKAYGHAPMGRGFAYTYQKAVAEALSECQRDGGRACFIDKVTCLARVKSLLTRGAGLRERLTVGKADSKLAEHAPEIDFAVLNAVSVGIKRRIAKTRAELEADLEALID